MKYIIIRNVEPAFVKILKNIFSLTDRFDKSRNKVGYEIQFNEFNEFIDSSQLKKGKNISEKSFSQAKRYAITQRTCKERLVLGYFFHKERVSSLNSLAKNIFSDPEYQKFFKSNNKSQLQLALANLMTANYIQRVERGLYKITLEGVQIVELMNGKGI